MSYHNGRTNSSPNTSARTGGRTTRAASTNARETRTSATSFNTINTISNPQTTCSCRDGVTYTNCGPNCECCDSVAMKRVDENTSSGIFSTTSCPCSSYAIVNNDGKVECEMKISNTKHRLKPVILKNHLINNTKPRVRDKWDCSNNSIVRCKQGDIEWNSFHIVRVDQLYNTEQITLYNSASSSSNCYIPPTTLRDYSREAVLNTEDQEVLQNYYAENGVVIEVKNLVNVRDNTLDVPMYDSIPEAKAHDAGYGSGKSIHSEYTTDEGIVKYFPGHHYPKKKLITECYISPVNGLGGDYDVLYKNIRANWNYSNSSTRAGKLQAKSGNNIQITILGKNKPTVSITIKNSSSRSILKRKLKNITVDGKYVYNLKIPSLPTSKKQQYYDIEISPSADTSYLYLKKEMHQAAFIPTGVLKYRVWQFKDPKFTFLASNSSIANATTTQSAVSISGEANGNREGQNALTHTTTITRASGTDNYYVNKTSLRLEDVITNNSAIKKTITNKKDKNPLECVNNFKYASVGGDLRDLEVGMYFIGKFEKTKTVFKSIDLDAHLKEACDDHEVIDIVTNKFELENTSGLIAGMKVEGINKNGQEFDAILSNVDCGVGITLNSHHSINSGVKLTFKWSDQSKITDITGNVITCLDCLKLPNNTELSFDNTRAPKIRGSVSFDKIGSGAITVTTVLKNFKFAQSDVTFTLDPDLFITNKPPAHDQHLEIIGGEELYVYYLKLDTDYRKNYKTVNITKQPSVGVLSNLKVTNSHYNIYTPPANFTGNDTIKFTVTDDNDVISEEKTIFITIK
mgnify:CR=1 FL=1